MIMFRLVSFRRWYLIPIVMAASLSLTLAVVAAARVTPSESTLSFKGLITESQQRTLQLAVEGGPVTNVQVVRHDLVDAASGAVILSSEITVEPLKIDRVEDTADLAITLNGVKRGGHYVGTLDIRYSDRGVTQTLPITLEAQLDAAPSVDATTDSKKLTWFVTDGTTSTQPIFLTQKTVGEAEVQEASILVMRGSKGQALPEGTVYVEAALPARLSPASALPITVGVKSGVPAGEYNGILLIKVRDQAAGIEVPIVVQSKHAPWWPLLTLAAGLLTALVLGWWNTAGQKKQSAAEALTHLRAKLVGADRLANDQIEAVIARVKEAALALNANAKTDTIDALVKAAEQELTHQQKKTDDLLAEIDKQIAQATNLRPGDGVRPKIIDRLIALRERTRQGAWEKFDDAVADQKDVQTDLDFWAKVIEQLSKVPADNLNEATTQLNAAPTFNAMQTVLKAYQQDQALNQLPLGRTFGTKGYAAEQLAARPELNLSFKTQITLRGGALIVGVIAYVFALLVGFITLYVVNDTFGADAQQYLSLFVWGAAIETVRAKAVTLTDLKAIIPAASSNAAPSANPAGGQA
jgi:hypothetical protein